MSDDGCPHRTYRVGSGMRCQKRRHDTGLHVAFSAAGKGPAVFWSEAGEVSSEAVASELAGLRVTGKEPGIAPGTVKETSSPDASVKLDIGVRPLTKAEAREQGFTGDSCGLCGSMRVVRNGACLLCRECGQSSGCS